MSKSGVRYADYIDGVRVARGKVVRMPDGKRVRFHACWKWNKLYWTADCGLHWEKDLAAALSIATALDEVAP